MAEYGEEIRSGLALQDSGDWPAALACYLRAIEKNPSDAEGLYRAGIAQAHEGRLDLSSDLLGRSLVVRPGFADAAQALGRVLLSQRKFKEAAAALERASALSPASAEIHFHLGTAQTGLKQLDRAAASYQRALKLKPELGDAHNELGNVYRAQGKLQEAARSYERATKAPGDHAKALYNLGTTRQIQKRYPKALDAYRRSLELNPSNPDAENNLGLVLREEGLVEEAISAFRRAVALKPDHTMAMVNLGSSLQRVNKLEESITVLEAALGQAPCDFRAYADLGNAYVAMNRPEEGIAAYEKALAQDPSLDEVRYNIALAHLVRGNFARGWIGYDSRLETAAHRRKYPFGKPRWSADQPVLGRKILVYAEQGLGDTIQFVRYLPLLEAEGAQVIALVQAPLRSLLAAQMPTVTFITARDPLPEHDLKCPLLSLPREFATRLDSIPSGVPYLAAPKAKVASWRTVFSKADGLKVGLVWSGNPKHQFDHNRSVSLELMSRVVSGVPAHFFAIQKELRGNDLERLSGMPRITNLSRYAASFEDTAAIVTGLDLVITVDTSVAHLAGALGKRAWVMLSHAPDWRWLLDRADSPWYPSIRLFRQPALGDWETVARQLNAELAALAR
jgi:tetratricopeptide (TPR) repeat protein